MLRLASALAALCALSIIPSRPALAARTASQPVTHVIVQLKGEPAAVVPNLKGRFHGRYRFDPGLPTSRWYASSLSHYQDSEAAYIRQQGINLVVREKFQLLINGFSATIPTGQLGRLASLTNVAAVMPVRRYVPQLDRSLPLVHVPEAWTQVGGGPNAGHNLRIANIDSGIDIKNPCFSDAHITPPGNGFPRADTQANLQLTNNKVIVARAFGDAGKHYSAADQQGHGTFTGAIEACDYSTETPLGTHVSGTAPDAYLMSYNIFPAGTGQTSADDPLPPALQAALLDGADVVNMSLGSPLGAGDLRLDADTLAVSAAIKAGVTVVVSAGNAGPTSQTVSSPAADPEAIAVGSTTNAHGIYSSLSVDGADVPVELNRVKANEGSHPWSDTIGPAPVVYVGLGRRPNDDKDHPSADDFAGKDLHGKIALIQRGGLFFETKLNNAAKAGAIGAVIFDNRAELNLITMAQNSANLPALFVSQDAGKAILAYLQGHAEATITMTATMSSFDETPNVLSDFSSRGYGADYVIKPDLVAPGQDIYSATESQVPNNEMYNPHGFTSQSGTSFSAPHVAGAAALVLQKHPKWTPAMVKSALMDTAGSTAPSDAGRSSVASVMEVGDGLLNVDAALSSTAYLSPAAISFGGINAKSSTTSRAATLTLNDAGGGSGPWQVTVQQLHGAAGVSISAASAVQVPSGGHADVPLKVSTGEAAAPGNYDGYVVLTKGAETLHAAYFVHVASTTIKAGSVLLVDDTLSRFQPDPPAPAVARTDVSSWYEKALTDLGKTYTYWDEGSQGTPSIQDLKQASAVIWFTGNNLNGFGPQNSNYEALHGPLSSADVSVLHSYMDAGGRLFVSGMGVPLSDPYWSALILGGAPSALISSGSASDLSLYDNARNDKDHKGGVSPPEPSARVDTRAGVHANKWLFGALKPIDFSTKGDGARDNLAVDSHAAGQIFGDELVGVPGLIPVKGNFSWQGKAFGQAILQTTNRSLAQSGLDVGVVSSDEPGFKHKGGYPGRSAMFSFGFEGINNNTGYATRDQVLQRIFQWFADTPTVKVSAVQYVAKRPVTLRASIPAVQYRWQVNGAILKTTAKPTQYRFPHSGRYNLRVQITDGLGHNAVSAWRTVTVR